MGNRNFGVIAHALGQANFIESLDVSSNKLTNEGAFKIATLMSETNKLRVLLMQHNSIMGKGGIAIAN